jgi:hypothetical protein
MSTSMLINTWVNVDFIAKVPDHRDNEDYYKEWHVSLRHKQARIRSMAHEEGKEIDRFIEDEIVGITDLFNTLVVWHQNRKAWMHVPQEVMKAFSDWVAEQELLHGKDEKGKNEDGNSNN